jgi:hypothetical protein
MSRAIALVAVLVWIACGARLLAAEYDEPEYEPVEPRQYLFSEGTHRLPPIDQEEEFHFATSPERKRPQRAGMAGGDQRSPVRASMFWMPAEPMTTQPGELTINGQSLHLAAPLWIEEGNVWLATGGVERLELGSNAILPDSQQPLPEELWKTSVGAMHFRDLDNGWQVGGILNVGSASDEPFGGLRDMTVALIGFLNIPSGERDAWNFMLIYSPTSQLPFPIPGVAYVWRPSDQLTMKIGIPFAIDYQATETLSLSATYVPLTNVQLLAKQRLGEAWCLYGGYEVTNDTYWLSDRQHEDDRLYFFDQRLKVGLERDLVWGLKADVSVAYVFDRQIFQADDFTGDRRDEIGIEPGLMGSLMIKPAQARLAKAVCRSSALDFNPRIRSTTCRWVA